MYSLVRKFLFRLDPEVAHRLVLRTLPVIARLYALRQLPPASPKTCFGLTFPNPVGLSAGFDKDGEHIDDWFRLGFGFVEVGTVTPRPQAGNPKKRLFRLPEARAIINRMGFNNAGVEALVSRLQARRSTGIVGVNIGKNKETPNDHAIEDYAFCMEKVYPYADYITINLSSPNTPGLRDLQAARPLDTLLTSLTALRDRLAKGLGVRRPLLVKLSPDLSETELLSFIETIQKHSIDGVIACNTTLDRAAVRHHPHAGESGGLSGAPIAERSRAVVAAIYQATKGQLPIIGVGGIDGVPAAKAMFAAGASLIQLYTGLIYEGPELLQKILQA